MALTVIVDSVVVPTAAVPIAEDSAAVPIAEDSAAALAAVVPSAEAHTAVVLTAADTAAAVAAEWVDADKSEHQFPHFCIRHPRNLAH